MKKKKLENKEETFHQFSNEALAATKYKFFLEINKCCTNYRIISITAIDFFLLRLTGEQIYIQRSLVRLRFLLQNTHPRT